MQRFFKPILVLLTLLLTASLTLTGCGGDTDVTGVPQTIVFGMQNDLETLDPQQMWTSFVAHTVMFGSPIVMGLDGETPTPYLAESFTVAEDGKSMIMVFPDDLKFSNGNPVTGADILASIERYMEISPYAYDWDDASDVTAEGQTVTIHFDAPTAFFYPVIASTYTAIVDVKAAEEMGDEAFGLNPVGIGPYIMQNWAQGSEVTYVQNPHFKSHLPFVENKGPWKFEKVTVRIIPDDLTIISELESGNVDVVGAIPTQYVGRIEANKDINLYRFPATGVNYLNMNTDKAPFNDLRFRQAINYALNKEDIKTAYEGHVEPLYGLLSPAQIGHSAEAESALKAQMAHDQQRAKTLLADLGYVANSRGILEKDGQALVIELLAMPEQRAAATVMQSQLGEVGISVEIREQARPYIREVVRDRDFDMAFATWSWSDGDIWYYGLHSSMGASVVWSSPQTDSMLEQQRRLIDPEERQAMFGQIAQTVADDVGFIPLFYRYTYTAVRANIAGYTHSTDGIFYWNDAYKK